MPSMGIALDAIVMNLFNHRPFRAPSHLKSSFNKSVAQIFNSAPFGKGVIFSKCVQSKIVGVIVGLRDCRCPNAVRRFIIS
jgi:hypothetical protein